MQINLELYHVLKDLNIPEDKAVKAASEEANEIHELKMLVGKMDTKINILLGLMTAVFLSILAKVVG